MSYQRDIQMRLAKLLVGRRTPSWVDAHTATTLRMLAPVPQLPGETEDCPSFRWNQWVLPQLDALNNLSLQAFWQIANEEVRICRSAPPGSFLAHVLTALGAEFASRGLEPGPVLCEPKTIIEVWMDRFALGCCGVPNCCQEHAYAAAQHTSAPTMGYFEEQEVPDPEMLLPLSIACRSVALQLLLHHLPNMGRKDFDMLTFLVDSHHRGHDPATIAPGSLLVRAVTAIRGEQERRDAAAAEEARKQAFELAKHLMLARERLCSCRCEAAAATLRAAAARNDMEVARGLLATGVRRALCAAAADLRRAEISLATNRAATAKLSPLAASTAGCPSRPLEFVVGAILAQAGDKARAANVAAGEARAEIADNALRWGNWIFALGIPLKFLAGTLTNWHSCQPEFPVLQTLLYMCNHVVDFLKLPEKKGHWLQDLVDDACNVWGGKPPPGSLLEILTAPLAPLAAPLVEVLTMAITGADAPPQDDAAADAPPQDDADDADDAPPQDDADDADDAPPQDDADAADAPPQDDVDAADAPPQDDVDAADAPPQDDADANAH